MQGIEPASSADVKTLGVQSQPITLVQAKKDTLPVFAAQIESFFEVTLSNFAAYERAADRENAAWR